MKRFALTEKGAADMLKAILAVTLSDLALMIPVGLLFTFTGDYLAGTAAGRRAYYLLFAAACLVLIFVPNYWQYNATFFATYVESGKRRISLAEKLRKLPLSFFGKKDLADLTNTIMADSETLEHASSHQIPQFYGSLISTSLICIGLFFYKWEMALAAVWPIPIAIFIVAASKKVQAHFIRRQSESKVRLNDAVQEFIEVSRDLKSCNAEDAYLSELEEKIDDVEKKAIGAELGQAAFIVSAQLILKIGIGTVAVVGSAMLLQGRLNVMEFFAFLLVASRLYEPMSGNLISGTRTGCVPGVGTRYLASPAAEVCSCIGARPISRSCLSGIMAEAHSIKKICVYDIRQEAAEEFAKWAGTKFGVEAVTCASTEEVVRAGDIISVAASKIKPVIVKNEWIKEGSLIVTTGGCQLDEAYLTSARIVFDNPLMHKAYMQDAHRSASGVDAIYASMLAGCVYKLIDAGKLPPLDEAVGLGDIAVGKAPGRTAEKDRILLETSGMPVEDIAWGYEIYRQAKAMGLGQELLLWDESYM